jgi:hypothetical protein
VEGKRFFLSEHLLNVGFNAYIFIVSFMLRNYLPLQYAFLGKLVNFSPDPESSGSVEADLFRFSCHGVRPGTKGQV